MNSNLAPHLADALVADRLLEADQARLAGVERRAGRSTGERRLARVLMARHPARPR